MISHANTRLHKCISMLLRILYGKGSAVIAVSRPRGVAHGYDKCFWASRGNRKTPQSRDDIIIKRYIIIIINYYCHVHVSWKALRITRGVRNIQNLPYIASYKYEFRFSSHCQSLSRCTTFYTHTAKMDK